MGVSRLDILYLYKQGEQMKITKIFQLFVLFASLYLPVIAATHQGGAEVEILVPKDKRRHLFTIHYSDTQNVFAVKYFDDGSSDMTATLSSIDSKTLVPIIEDMHRRATQKMLEMGHIKLPMQYGGTTQIPTISINSSTETDIDQKDKSCCGCWSRFFKFICCCR